MDEWQCPNCGNNLSPLGQPTYIGSDSYTYRFCARCQKEFEIIGDMLYGGEPEIKEV